MPQLSQESFDQWCILDLFGHQRLAGRVTEAAIGGCSFLRLDVPDLPAVAGDDGEAIREAKSGFTRFFGQGAIYSMSPVSKEIVMGILERVRAAAVPIQAYELPDRACPAITSCYSEEEENGEEED